MAAFVLIGVLGFVWLIGWLAIYQTPPAPVLNVCSPQAVGQLLRMRFVWSFVLSKIFLDPVWYFYVFWFPEYLKQVHRFNLAAIYLIHDRDPLFTAEFLSMLADVGVQSVKLPPRSPNLMQSLRDSYVS